VQHLDKKNKYLESQLQEKTIALEMVETQIIIVDSNYKAELKRVKKFKKELTALQLIEQEREARVQAMQYEVGNISISIRA
jgi:hypothetical protein